MRKTCFLVIIYFFLTLKCLSKNEKPNLGDPNYYRANGFVENKGQIVDQNLKVNTEVKYLLNLTGMNIQLRSNGFSYDSYFSNKVAGDKLNFKKEENSNGYEFHRVDIEFIGSNTNPIVEVSEQSNVYFNFYTEGSGNGISTIKSYKRIIYRNIYDKIDLEFTYFNDKFKFNFILNEGADINNINWKYNGAINSDMKEEEIEIVLSRLKITEAIPESYKILNDLHRKAIKVLYDKRGNNTYGFKGIKKPIIKKGEKIVIDPIPNLQWATYFGGSGTEYFSSFCIDTIGNTYVVGHTGSSASIATSGAYQTGYGGGAIDAIILSFRPNGTLRWATYYGKNGNDDGGCIVIDKTGSLFISGVTGSSAAMSTPGSHQSSYGGGTSDAFLAKFDTTGQRIWSTYYGGSLYDDSYGCSVDKYGNVYLTGSTSSTSSISTVSSHQAVFGGGPYDGYLAKFSTNGVRQWSTYLGDTGDDGSATCINDIKGNVYVCGYTSSTASISTIGSHQAIYGGGTYDGFLAKFNSAGLIKWSTYYGGSSQDCVQQVYNDSIGSSIYIAGFSDSPNAISSVGAFQISNGGSDDAFLVKFDTLGARQWGTYYGGPSLERGYGVCTDVNYVYTCGMTDSPSAISTPSAYNTSFNGGGKDAFFAKFDKNGVRQWGSYYGGTGYEFASAIQVDKKSNIYIIGETNSYSLATVGAYQPTLGGGYDGFLVKFNEFISTSVVHVGDNENKALVFPNPNHGNFFIRSNFDLKGFIIDGLGQKVYDLSFEKGNNRNIEIAHLPEGIYFLILNNELSAYKIVIIK